MESTTGLKSMGIDANALGAAPMVLVSNATVKRSGQRLKLVRHDGSEVFDRSPDPRLASLLVKARGWWERLSEGQIDIASLAREEKVSASYITRVVRLAFLSPEVVEEILDGKQNSAINAGALLATGAIRTRWEAQEKKCLT